MKEGKKLSQILLIFFAVLSIALGMTVLVNADNAFGQTLDRAIYVQEAGTYSVTFPKADYQGQSANFSITNASSVPMKFVISESVNRTKVMAYGDDFKALATNSNSPYNKVITRYFAPTEMAGFELTFANDYGNGVSRLSSFSITATPVSFKDRGGMNFESAENLSLEDSVSSFLNYLDAAPTKNARYFCFTTPNRRILKLDLTSGQETTWMDLYNANDRNAVVLGMRAQNRTSTDTIILESGTYFMKVYSNYSVNQDPAVYTLTLSGRDYIPATGVSLTCTDNSLTAVKGDGRAFNFTASTLPANSDDKLTYVTLNGDTTFDAAEKINANNTSFSISNYELGYNYVQVSTSNGLISDPLNFIVQPQAPSLTNNVNTYYNKVVFGRFDNHYQGNGIKVYLYNGKKWVLKRSGTPTTSFTVLKLKANTKYKFKIVSTYTDKNGNTVESAPLIKTYKTARKDKPAISSIKVRNVSVSSYNKWVKESGHYIYKKFYKTHYTLTITLKKKIPGSKGIRVATSGTQGTNFKGKKTRYVISCNAEGNWKGRTITVWVGAYSQKGTLGGYGPEVKKKVTLR